MTTLTDFLLARIAEDEGDARAAVSAGDASGHWVIVSIQYEGSWPINPSDTLYRDDDRECEDWTVHASRHDPARVLAECEAKRRVVELHAGEHVCPSGNGVGCTDFGGIEEWQRSCPTLRALASIYADHDDYREEWRP